MMRLRIRSNAEQLLACLKAGTVSTNVHMRKLHNFCLSMNWLPWPLIPKRLWPEVRFQPKRAITVEEHQLIIEREKNPERGGSQSDIANLKAEDVDWPNQTIAYARQKTGSLAMIHFGPELDPFAPLSAFAVLKMGAGGGRLQAGGIHRRSRRRTGLAKGDLTYGFDHRVDDDHQRILAAERNSERNLFYRLLWEIGSSQSDAAALTAENIEWQSRTLTYFRMKTGEQAQITVSRGLVAILVQLSHSRSAVPKNIRDDRQRPFCGVLPPLQAVWH
jgi:hypothetical protein